MSQFGPQKEGDIPSCPCVKWCTWRHEGHEMELDVSKNSMTMNFHSSLFSPMRIQRVDPALHFFQGVEKRQNYKRGYTVCRGNWLWLGFLVLKNVDVSVLNVIVKEK